MSEYRRKTLRSFYCEEGLWKSYEKLARERDVTIDQLLGEALQRYLDGGSPAAQPAAAPAAPMAAPATGPVAAASTQYLAGPPSRPTAPVLQSPQTGEQRGLDRPTMERIPAVRTAPPPPPPRPAGPPAAPTAPPSGGMPRLFVHYGGHSVPVAKAEFVIGRGSTGTDLMIKDGNVSRKHAVVLFHNGAFFIQDLGSTNGVEFHGQRVQTKAIEEGDAFTICDHEITFSYRG